MQHSQVPIRHPPSSAIPRGFEPPLCRGGNRERLISKLACTWTLTGVPHDPCLPPISSGDFPSKHSACPSERLSSHVATAFSQTQDFLDSQSCMFKVTHPSTLLYNLQVREGHWCLEVVLSPSPPPRKDSPGSDMLLEMS